MATLVLTTVGSMVGGPIGGAIGAMIGQQIDGAILAPKGRQGPRLGDLAVQTSSYGTQISRIFGSMRVGGTVIWATDLKEDRHKQGGGKGRAKTTTYSYSASFAVALSGREIVRVGRIWADGKLLRGAAGDFKTETGFRLYHGAETQGVDPLIAAAEGRGSAPAFRGIAYAVFENFQLGDYGNRIPSLTFEVVADEGGTTTGTVVQVVSSGAVIAHGGQALGGFAAHGDSVRAVIATLGESMPAPIHDDGTTLRMGVSDLPVAAIGARLPGGTSSRLAAGQVPDAVSIGYHDPARDYQAGLQRATLGGPGRIDERIALPAAIDAGVAKAIAAARLDTHWRTRERRSVTLPWRDMGLRPGRLVRLAETGPAPEGIWRERVWQVTGWTLERMAVKLELAAHGRAGAPALPAVAGRSVAGQDLVHGATTLHVFDAPQLDDIFVAGARLLVAAAGASAGWRVAALEASLDGGATWDPTGATAHAATIGSASGALGAAGSTLFDRRHSVEVTLLNDAMWLESRDDDALVAGANLAMLGNELIQFGDAQPLGNRRFRLSRLLRGRRGSEWAASTHVAGETFVLIEADTLASVPVPDAAIGSVAQVAARGVGDGAVPTIASARGGTEAVRPPAPVHLRAQKLGDGSLDVRWTRRSRAGWAWIDGVDAPLSEAVERYRIEATGGTRERIVEVETARWIYDSAARVEDGAQSGCVIEVEQIGSVGASRSARLIVGQRNEGDVV